MKPRTPTIRHYLANASGSIGDQVPDADLLGRFASGRDQVAFELLVWRHTGMVLRICRGILRDYHLAEDACQATFLALARQAGLVGRKGSVVGWLYRVARRSALRATRHNHQFSSTSLVDVLQALPLPEEEDPALVQVLNDELARLPERYRVPLLLCFFEGLTHQVAAARLGVPIGTLATRIARAKDRLGRRLTARGFEVTAGGLLIALIGSSATARPLFVAVTAQAAVAFATGAGEVPGVSESVLEMAKGAMPTMINTKLRWISGLMIACGVVVLGGLWVIGAQEPPKTPPAKVEVAPANEQLFHFNKIAIDANDLAEAFSLDIYKFKIDIPKKQKFNVILREREDKDAKPKILFGFTFQRNEKDGPITLRVDFARLDKTAGGVLLSEDKQAQLRVTCSDCSPGGSFVTIVTTPLSGIKTTQKAFFVHQSDKQNTELGLNETRLLTFLDNVKDSSALAELVVVKE